MPKLDGSVLLYFIALYKVVALVASVRKYPFLFCVYWEGLESRPIITFKDKRSDK